MKNPPLALLLIGTLTLVSCGSGMQKSGTPPAQSALDRTTITEKYWKLVRLEGQKVTMGKNQEREIYFMLKTEQNQVRGFAGCNTFKGTYTLEKGQRIRFSSLAATRKACPEVDLNESEFLEVFELADNYSIKGDTLSLNVGRRAPLAVFEAVYF
jgi:heat shock protein HslJ